MEMSSPPGLAMEMSSPPGLAMEMSSVLSLGDALRQSESSTASLLPTLLGSPSPEKRLCIDTSLDADSNMDFGLCTHPTTLIIRGLSTDTSRDLVKQSLDEQGFVKAYDFLHCPLDYRTRASLGEAIVNFTTTDEGLRFRDLLRDQVGTWPRGCHSVWATDWQGLATIIARFRDSSVMHNIVPDAFKPAVFHDGRRAPFPRPTEKLEAPLQLPQSVWRAWTAETKGRRNTRGRKAPRVLDSQLDVRQDRFSLELETLVPSPVQSPLPQAFSLPLTPLTSATVPLLPSQWPVMVPTSRHTFSHPANMADVEITTLNVQMNQIDCEETISVVLAPNKSQNSPSSGAPCFLPPPGLPVPISPPGLPVPICLASLSI